jgi:hypothetical protein
MLIECRVETLTESGWPEFTGSLNPLCLALGEKRQDAKPERGARARRGRRSNDLFQVIAANLNCSHMLWHPMRFWFAGTGRSHNVDKCSSDNSLPKEGHIGLQCHTGNVQFKKVMNRTLPN